MDQRLGPGVLTYSDGRQDVGLWIGKYLLKLCTSAEESFSLSNFPEYATFMQPSVISGSQTQVLVDPSVTCCKIAQSVVVSIQKLYYSVQCNFLFIAKIYKSSQGTLPRI